MNMKMRSLKKSLFSVYNKIIQTNTPLNSSNNVKITDSFEPKSSLANEESKIGQDINCKKNRSHKIRKASTTKSLNRSNFARQKRKSASSKIKCSTSSSSSASTYSSVESISSKLTSIHSQNFPEDIKSPVSQKVISTSSSGYGTSNGSPIISVFVNLDNYFYDENISNIKDKAQENTTELKSSVVKLLLEYQQEFLSVLKTGLTNHVRPLSVLLDSSLFFEIFQNIEKIFSINEFIRNAINEMIHLTNDVYSSTVQIINEYISILYSTYELYFQGYQQALVALNNQSFIDTLKWLNDNNNNINKEFDIQNFISLPIANITKTYSVFASLLEMTQISELDDYDRLSTICFKLKTLMGPTSDESFCLNSLKFLSEDVCFEMTNNKNDSIENLINTNNKSYPQNFTAQKLKYSKQKSKQSSTDLPCDYTDNDGNKFYFV